jgi:two-component system, sporulation sensor kinase E
LTKPMNLTIPFSLSALKYYFDQDSQGSVLIINEDETIGQGNKVFFKCFNCREEDLPYMRLADFVHNNVTLSELLSRQLDGLGDGIPEVEIKLEKGNIVNSKYSLFQISVDQESGKKQYMLILHDIHYSHNLSLLQQFSGTFMKDVNLGVILVNMDFMLKDISDMACRILGVQRHEVINKTMEEVFVNVPIEHQLVQRTVLDGQIIRNHAISWTNNQERYELLMDSNLLKDERGNTVGAYVIFKDVSNLRSLEEQVQRSDRLAMIGQISAGTAHEIRNPLTSIKGFLQVLKKSMNDRGMEKEFGYIEIMLKEIDRINELVSEFLLLSKSKHSVYSPVSISTVLREILPIINNEAILHNVTVQYEAAVNLPMVVADRELLKQVCLNLSKNGIEAMTDGGILTLTERVDKGEQKILVEIHDSGSGIPAFLIDKIFDPFFTTKENGTGLGLSVCQRIIHDIGGTIRVSSKGFGTTFTISIPYSKA